MYIDMNYIHSICDLLKHMSNTVRYSVLMYLNKEPMSVTELNKRIDVSQSALSQHLKMLRLAKIIQPTKKGTSVEYSLCNETVREIINALTPLKFGSASDRKDNSIFLSDASAKKRKEDPVLLSEPSQKKRK